MILQRTKGTLKPYKKTGCYLFDLFNWSAVFNPNLAFSVEFANHLFKPFQDNKIVDSEVTVLSPNRLFHWFGINAYIREDFDYDGYGHHAPPDYMCKPWEFEVCYWEADEGHFVCGNGHGLTTYDSWGSWNGRDPFSYTVMNGVLINKRIFVLEDFLPVGERG